MMSLAGNIDSSYITPCTQEEADFLIILHVHHTSILESNKLMIRIANTDIVIIGEFLSIYTE